MSPKRSVVVIRFLAFILTLDPSRQHLIGHNMVRAHTSHMRFIYPPIALMAGPQLLNTPAVRVCVRSPSYIPGTRDE